MSCWSIVKLLPCIQFHYNKLLKLALLNDFLAARIGPTQDGQSELPECETFVTLQLYDCRYIKKQEKCKTNERLKNEL